MLNIKSYSGNSSIILISVWNERNPILCLRSLVNLNKYPATLLIEYLILLKKHFSCKNK